MLSVGITGGIGSGKSRVGRIFQALGFRLYEADARARHLMNTHPTIIAQVSALLGPQAYQADGTLDRAYVGKIVFQAPEKLKALNAIVHPETGKDFANWIAETPADYRHTFVLKEAAILYESGAYLQNDHVLTIYAPKRVRIDRVIQRDQTTQTAILARMDKQWADLLKIQRADWTIINDGYHHLLPQVAAFIRFMQAQS